MRLGAWLALLSAAMGVTARAHADTIYVLSQGTATLTEIDSATDEIKRTLVLPLKAPAGLALSPTKPLAFITHPDAKAISIVDCEAWRVKATYGFTGMPFGIAASGNGKIYVADWSGSRVAEIDAETGTLERSVAVERAPAGLALSPDDKTLVAANRESDSVSVIETDGFFVKATIGVGRAPFAVSISPDGTRALVGNVQDSTASLIDLDALEVIATEKTGAAPYGAAFGLGGGMALVVNQESGTVAAMDGALKSSARPIKVGSYPEGIWVTHDGHKAYVANWFSDSVSVIGLDNAKELRRIKCAAGPRAVAGARWGRLRADFHEAAR